MFQKMRIFDAVAKKMSFTEAALALGISQSAASQSVAALERQLGTALIERRGRRIGLTPAGRYFAGESAKILDAVERLEQDMHAIAWTETARLRIAYSNLFRGRALEEAIGRFAASMPEAAVDVAALCHEEIYEALLGGKIDLAISDQRRAFSSDFENIVLAETPVYAELSRRHPLAQKKRLTVADLRPLSCILIAPKGYREAEEAYYANFLGFKGKFTFADTLDAARLTASGGRSFLLAQGRWSAERQESELSLTTCIPLFKAGRLVKERFCAFCRKERRSALTFAFMKTLSEVFAQSFPSSTDAAESE